jgi:hypothetical protein
LASLFLSAQPLLHSSAVCAEWTVIFVRFELIATKSQLKLPERFAKLPLAVWLLFWLLPVPPLWFVLRNVWPKNIDPNGAIGVLTMICLVLYIPTILAVIKPVDKEAADQKGKKRPAEENDNSDKIDFNVDFNVDSEDDSNAKNPPDEPDTSRKIGNTEMAAKPEKAKSKSRKKRK